MIDGQRWLEYSPECMVNTDSLQRIPFLYSTPMVSSTEALLDSVGLCVTVLGAEPSPGSLVLQGNSCSPQQLLPVFLSSSFTLDKSGCNNGEKNGTSITMTYV